MYFFETKTFLMIKTCSICSLLFCLIPLQIHGAEAQTVGESISLESLIQMALQQNPEIKGFHADLESQEAKIGPAGAYEDPMLSVQAVNLPVKSLRLDQDEMSGIQLGLSQKIPFPGKRSNEREIARLKTAAAEKRLQQKKLDIVRDVKKVYYDLYLKNQRKMILTQQRSFLKQLLAASRNQYALNKVSQAVVLNLQVDEASLIDEELKSESDIHEAQAELSHLIGHEKHFFMGPLEKRVSTKVNLDAWDDDKIAAAVEKNSFEILALVSESEAGQVQVTLARKGYLPDFEISANYMFRKPLEGMPAATAGNRDFVGGGVAVSIPLWAGSKQSEQIKGAAADHAKAEAQLDNVRLMLTHQARALFAQLRESKKRIELLEGGLLQLTAQAVSSGKSSYLTGRLDHATFLESLRRQQNTQYSYQEAVAKFEVQLAQLEALMAVSLRSESK